MIGRSAINMVLLKIQSVGIARWDSEAFITQRTVEAAKQMAGGMGQQ